MSTKYLNEAELDHKRHVNECNVCYRGYSSKKRYDIINTSRQSRLKRFCYHNDIKLREYRNMMDWLRYWVYQADSIKEVDRQVSKRY